MIIFKGEYGAIHKSYNQGNDFYIIKGKKYKITAFHKKIIKYNRILSFIETFIIVHITSYIENCPILLKFLFVILATILLTTLFHIICVLIYSFIRKEYK